MSACETTLDLFPWRAAKPDADGWWLVRPLRTGGGWEDFAPLEPMSVVWCEDGRFEVWGVDGCSYYPMSRSDDSWPDGWTCCRLPMPAGAGTSNELVHFCAATEQCAGGRNDTAERSAVTCPACLSAGVTE